MNSDDFSSYSVDSTLSFQDFPLPRDALKKNPSRDYNDVASTASTPAGTLKRQQTGLGLEKATVRSEMSSVTSPNGTRRTQTYNNPTAAVYVAADGSSYNPPPELYESSEFRSVDTEFVMDLFLTVANYFDPITCPRYDIQYIVYTCGYAFLFDDSM
jgi:hypothetical protein